MLSFSSHGTFATPHAAHCRSLPHTRRHCAPTLLAGGASCSCNSPQQLTSTPIFLGLIQLSMCACASKGGWVFVCLSPRQLRSTTVALCVRIVVSKTRDVCCVWRVFCLFVCLFVCGCVLQLRPARVDSPLRPHRRTWRAGPPSATNTRCVQHTTRNKSQLVRPRALSLECINLLHSCAVSVRCGG